MLDIQELDDQVFRELSPHDLAQCARVSKKWHVLATPHLWRDLTCLERARREHWRAFHSVVLMDYLAEKQMDEGHATEQSAQAPSHPPLPTLSKYGHCIRLLPDPYHIQTNLGAFRTRQVEPTGLDLLLHLLKRSPDSTQVESFGISTYAWDPTHDDAQRTMLDFVLPRVRRLYIHGRLPKSHAAISWMANLLDQCTAVLQGLDLGVETSTGASGTLGIEEEPTEHEARGWASFKELSLRGWADITDTKTFWQWLFRKCGRVEKLAVHKVPGNAQVLTEVMLAHMPQLTEIILAPGTGGYDRITEDNVARLLSGTTKGWKRMTLGPKTDSGRVAMEALEKHFSTLETLELKSYSGYWRHHTVHVLRSCPHLQSFINADPFVNLDIEMFIDRDPDADAGSLRPWKCEHTLKVLKVSIKGIPRMDIPEYYFEEVAWDGQRQRIQSGFFDRLARLTNLETLWLRDQYNEDDLEYLELSLESGLHKLSGLKRLKELCFKGLSTEIGVKEVEWMVENWPSLRVINGLDVDGDNREAAEWLQENCPHISV